MVHHTSQGIINFIWVCIEICEEKIGMFANSKLANTLVSQATPFPHTSLSHQNMRCVCVTFDHLVTQRGGVVLYGPVLWEFRVHDPIHVGLATVYERLIASHRIAHVVRTRATPLRNVSHHKGSRHVAKIESGSIDA